MCIMTEKLAGLTWKCFNRNIFKIKPLLGFDPRSSSTTDPYSSRVPTLAIDL